MSSLLIPHQTRPPLFLLSVFLGCITGIGFILFYKIFFDLTDNLLWYGIPVALLIWVIIRLALTPALARSSTFILGTLLFFVFAFLIMQGEPGEFSFPSIASPAKGHLNIYCFIGILLLIMSAFDSVSMSSQLSKLFIAQVLSFLIVMEYLPNYFSSYYLLLWIPVDGAVLVEIMFLLYKEVIPLKLRDKKS